MENATVVFSEPRKVVLENRPIPTPASGEVLIKTKCTLISTGTELSLLAGNYPPGSCWDQIAEFPLLPGYCNIGEVIAVGEGGDESLVGKRVASWGNHAAYCCMPQLEVELIPHAEIPDEQAAFFTLAQIVMQGVRRSGIRWGESAAVFGMGLLGQLTVLFCRIAGVTPIFALDSTAERLQYLPQGFSNLIPVNVSEVNFEQIVRDCNRGRKVDVIFEVTGSAKAIPTEFKILRTQGRFVVLSSPIGETSFDFHDLCNRESFTIIGAHNHSHIKVASPDNPWTLSRDAELFFDWIADDTIDVKHLISHQHSYQEAPSIYESLLENRSSTLGIILMW